MVITYFSQLIYNILIKREKKNLLKVYLFFDFTIPYTSIICGNRLGEKEKKEKLAERECGREGEREIDR